MKTEILVMDCEERGAFWLNLKSDYRILFAASAGGGLERLSERTALAFLSLTLPDTDGMEVIGKIKEKYPSLPVIITAPCGPERPCTCMEAFKRGARDYIMKPLSSDEVLRKIEAVLSGKDGSRPRREASASVRALDGEQYPGIPTHLVNGVLKVKDFVAQNYSDSLSLAAACKMAATSKTYFCRFFKSITGHTLRRYQHAVKIRVAEELLKDERLSVTDVAIMVGYSDSNYFSTIYKKLTGVSPRSRKTAGLDLETRKEVLNRVREDASFLLLKSKKRQHVYSKGGRNGNATEDIGRRPRSF